MPEAIFNLFNVNFEDLVMISVIIPVYKVESFLPYCLDSVLNNTYRDLEVICVNDGSPDACGEILERYERKDSRVRVINKENAGVSSARNVGLDAARGEWVAFIDSDDAVHYRYFEFLIDAWEKDGRRADVVVCGALWHEKGELPSYKLSREVKNIPQLQQWNQIRNYMLSWAFLWGKIYRRDYIGTDRIPQHLKLSEDTYFNICELAKSSTCRVIISPAAEYLYRVNPASAYHTVSRKNMLESYSLLLEKSRTFVTREGRIVASEISIRHLFSISRSDSDIDVKGMSRKWMKEGLKIWGCTGFISIENFVMWVKFCIYYCIPSLASLGMVVHRYRHR